MTAFDRPLTDQEKSLLLALATREIADRFNSTHDTPCSDDEASDVLARLVAEGKVEIAGDAEVANVYINGSNLLVEVKRDWLAFHAQYPGNDPMKNRRRS